MRVKSPFKMNMSASCMSLRQQLRNNGVRGGAEKHNGRKWSDGENTVETVSMRARATSVSVEYVSLQT